MWTKLFLEEQGCKINRNIVYQDNKSSILLMKDGSKVKRGEENPTCED